MGKSKRAPAAAQLGPFCDQRVRFLVWVSFGGSLFHGVLLWFYGIFVGFMVFLLNTVFVVFCLDVCLFLVTGFYGSLPYSIEI